MQLPLGERGRILDMLGEGEVAGEGGGISPNFNVNLFASSVKQQRAASLSLFLALSTFSLVAHAAYA